MNLQDKSTKAIYRAYLELQKLANSDVNIAVKTDTIRAYLRDTLADLQGLPAQSVQEFVEDKSRKYL